MSLQVVPESTRLPNISEIVALFGMFDLSSNVLRAISNLSWRPFFLACRRAFRPRRAADYFLTSFTRAKGSIFPPSSPSISHCQVSVLLLYANVVWKRLPSLPVNRNAISSPLRASRDAMAVGVRPPPPVESSHKHAYWLDGWSQPMKTIASYEAGPQRSSRATLHEAARTRVFAPTARRHRASSRFRRSCLEGPHFRSYDRARDLETSVVAPMPAMKTALSKRRSKGSCSSGDTSRSCNASDV